MSSMNADQCEPNLVPILDMVFQLITFFMLVVNFKAVDVDRDLMLPVVGSASPTDVGDQGDIFVINIRSDGSIKIRGAVVQGIDTFLQFESAGVAAFHGIEPGADLPVTTVLRVDKTVRFERLMKVVDACKANRYRRIDFMVVRNPGDEDGTQ